MANPDTNTTETSHSFGEILHRCSGSVFLFALVLTTLLLLSWFLLLPQLTEVEIAGSVRGLTELREYRDHLSKDIADMQERRDKILLPLRDSELGSLLESKYTGKSILNLRSELSQVAKNLVSDNSNAVHIALVTFNADTNTLSVRGRVSGVGPRSMTVLAQFIETLRALPNVTGIQGARFERLGDPEHGFYSPFHLHLVLL